MPAPGGGNDDPDERPALLALDDGWEWFDDAGRQRVAQAVSSSEWLGSLGPTSAAALRDEEDRPLDVDTVRAHALTCLAIATDRSTLPFLDDDDLSALHAALTDLAVITRVVAGDPASRSESALHAASALEAAADQTGAVLRHRITPRRDGRFRVRWSEDERVLVRLSIERLDSVLESGHEALTRLTPPAYGEDEQLSTEFAAVARYQLTDSRRGAYETVKAALDRPILEEAELHALLRSINDVRLVMGTQLDVSEDEHWLPAPDSEHFADARTYYLLSGLLGDVVWALRRSM